MLKISNEEVVKHLVGLDVKRPLYAISSTDYDILFDDLLGFGVEYVLLDKVAFHAITMHPSFRDYAAKAHFDNRTKFYIYGILVESEE